MNNSSTASSGGISVLSVLGIVFVTLKLLGVINWSWWWVTAPFWAPIVIFCVMLGVMVWAKMK